MQIKMDDTLIYKDAQLSNRYGTGVVTAISPDEYTILWSGRGVTKYKRMIIDGKLAQIFMRVDKMGGLPKERHLQLGTAKVRVAFNENYDRAKLASLCERLKMSEERNAKDVATSLAEQLFTKKFALRGGAKAALGQLAELCDSRSSTICNEARDISKELFFGYVLQKSDFHQPDRGE